MLKSILVAAANTTSMPEKTHRGIATGTKLITSKMTAAITMTNVMEVILPDRAALSHQPAANIRDWQMTVY